MLDLTPGLDPEDHTLEYRGRSAEAVMGAFEDQNKYPEGAINLIIPPNDLNITAGRWEFETEGASLLGVLSGRFGIGALVLGVLGLALAPFTEGGSLVVQTVAFAVGALLLLDRTPTTSEVADVFTWLVTGLGLFEPDQTRFEPNMRRIRTLFATADLEEAYGTEAAVRGVVEPLVELAARGGRSRT